MSTRQKMIFLFLLIFLFQLLSAQGFDLSFWNNIRNSSYTINDELHIRCETLELPGLETEIFYTTQEGWESEEMQQFSGFTYEAIIPALLGETQYCRFRTETDTLVGMMPAFMPDDIFPPEISELSLVADDPIGDVLVEDAPHLDITREYFGYSNSRFYSAISNNDGNFPTDSGGFFPDEFYFYTTTIFNPENVLIDSVVYCLIYADIPMIIDPGLYRITGTEISLESFEWIGDIETVIFDSTLIMACNIETLTNDEYFGEWPNLSNTLGLEFLTCQLTLPSEFLFADFSILSFQNIDQYIIEPFTNILPEISDIHYSINVGNSTVTFAYSDENHHFPLIAELLVSQSCFQMLPTSFNYSQPVIFETTFPYTNWEEATIRVSDNGYEFVEETIYNTGVDNSKLHPATAGYKLFNFPNPFKPSGAGRSPATTIYFTLPENFEDVRIEIYNLKGQKIKTLECNNHVIAEATESLHHITWDDTDENNQPVSSGVYFYGLKIAGKTKAVKKMILMK